MNEIVWSLNITKNWLRSYDKCNELTNNNDMSSETRFFYKMLS